MFDLSGLFGFSLLTLLDFFEDDGEQVNAHRMFADIFGVALHIAGCDFGQGIGGSLVFHWDCSFGENNEKGW